MSEPQAYLNGRFLPASQTMIPPVDAGFVLGASVTEQLRTFGGQLFRLDDHLARLERSLELVGIEPGLTRAQFAEISRELVAHNHPLLGPGDDLGLSVFVTPGVYASYAGPEPVEPLVCLHTYALPFRLWASKYEKGQALVVSDVRQVPPECWPPELKCRSRMHYYLADQQAAAKDPGSRAVLLDMDGYVTETSTANVLIYKVAEGLVSVPHHKVLHGISMATLMEMAEAEGITVSQRNLTPHDLASAEEMLLSSTPFCLLPATRLNGRPIADGRPGPVFQRLLAAWSERMGLDIAGQAKQFAARTGHGFCGKQDSRGRVVSGENGGFPS